MPVEYREPRIVGCRERCTGAPAPSGDGAPRLRSALLAPLGRVPRRSPRRGDGALRLRTTLLSEADGEAGSCALHAGDFLDGLRDGVAEPVQVIRFELDDDIVGARDGVDGGDSRAGVGEFLDGGTYRFRLANIGFDED